MENTLNINWHIRGENAQDIEAVQAVTLAAFETNLEANLLQKLRTDPAWISGLSVVAESPAGKVVGHAVFTRCFIGEVPALFLGPVSVLPKYQNQGIGSAVIRDAMRRAGQLGENFLVLVGHPNYYPRFGFQRASRYGIRLAIDAPDEAVMAMSLDPGRPLPPGIVQAAEGFGM